MASTHWRTGHTVNSLLQQRDAGWDFLPLVHLLTQARLQSVPHDNDDGQLQQLASQLRFQSSLAADFPPSDVRLVDTDDNGRTHITNARYGLLSQDGPLPAPFIEWLRELANQHDLAMVDFLELFDNRLLALRYLMSSSVQPMLLGESAEHSRSGQLLRGMAGYLMESREDQADFELAGLFANSRLSLPLLRQLLLLSLGLPLQQLRSCLGGWMYVDEQDHSYLGHSHNTRLGQTACLGKRVWNQQQGIELKFAPLPWDHARLLLPAGSLHAQLRRIIERITDRRVDCRILLQIPAIELPPQRLSQGNNAYTPLGIASFLGRQPDPATNITLSFTIQGGQ
ncbi:type VI secretion system baseplate subunit TssG [Oceanobacter mangrovi]|uniref:type VI secretion system baseplate subunit TssG n=1 Tax=Oceanobacter mangrovi TaxID=2862510 RepID=UPI001C8E4EDF|nr:type VI secretion system baseplate subunit TssG [Oceanobacter mangrovi]